MKNQGVRLSHRIRGLIPSRREGHGSRTDLPRTGAEVLERVKSLDVDYWTYTFEQESVLHLGPMAQDFASRFGLGSDNRVIHPADQGGVLLVAIQELARRIEVLESADGASGVASEPGTLGSWPIGTAPSSSNDSH